MMLARHRLLIVGLLAVSRTRLFSIDCNQNGVDDPVEIRDGGALDCNYNGIPDACDLLPVSFGFVPKGRTAPLETLSMSLARLDADDAVDLIRWNTSIAVHRNNGAGGFEPAPSWSQAPDMLPVGGVAFVDAEGDGDLDLVVRIANRPYLKTFLNNGSAVFTDVGTIPFGEEVRDLEAGDLDGDGRDDLAVLTASQWITLTNDADGVGFTERAAINLAPFPWALVIAELNGDQRLDVAVVRYRINQPGEIEVFFGAEGASPHAGGKYSSGRGSTSIIAADIDGDDHHDLITGDFDLALDSGGVAAAGFSILLNSGNGDFGPARSIILGRPVAEPVAVDLDEDGNLDLIIPRASLSRGDVALYSNQGDGKLIPGTLPLAIEDLPPPLRQALPTDIDGDGDLDLVCTDTNWLDLILENRPILRSTDCDRSGIPDECECDHDPQTCLDCNQNGTPDQQDLTTGASLDANRNGVPDECEKEPSFVVAFDARSRAAGPPGSIVSIPVTTQIHSLGLNPGEPGLQGWSVMVAAEGADIADITTSGTVAAPAPEGLRVNGFELTGWVSGTQCDMQAGSAVVLSFDEPVSLDVSGSPHDIFRMRLETEAPPEGTRTVTLRVIPGNCGASLQRKRPDEGSGASGAITALTLLGATVVPSLRAKRITVFSTPGAFHRGDVNDDGRLDISDPIRLLEKLFLGSTALSCRDAADSNNDGRLDVSDAIWLFGFLFIGGAAPAYPGPPGAACDIDPPTPTGSEGCDQYRSC